MSENLSENLNEKNEQEIIKDLIAAGLVGAGIGAILSKNKKDGALTGTILAALIYGSMKVFENSKKSGVPFLIVEDNKLYQINPDGTKTFIKNIEKSNKKYPEKFTLKII